MFSSFSNYSNVNYKMASHESDPSPNHELFEELLAQLPLTEGRPSSVGQGEGVHGDHGLHFMDEDQFGKLLFFEIF